MISSSEIRLVSLLKSSEAFTSLGLTVSLDVPNDRPDVFVTVERTGGSTSIWQDNPILAVQVSAKGTDTQSPRTRAAKLADSVASIIRGFRDSENDVFHIEVSSVYNYPDPDAPSWGRYQIVVSITFQ